MDILCREIVEHCRRVGWFGGDAERDWAEPEQIKRWSSGFENPTATEEEIAAAEASLGFPIPQTYRAMLSAVANGRFGPGMGFVGVASDRCVDPNPVSTYGFDLAEVYGNLRSFDWPERWLAIADFGCGNLLVLNADNAQVARFDASGVFSSSFISEDASLEEYLRLWMSGEDMEMRDDLTWTCALTGRPIE